MLLIPQEFDQLDEIVICQITDLRSAFVLTLSYESLFHC